MEFHAPTEDMLFTLRAAGADKVPGFDADLAREIAEQFGRFAAETLAPLNGPGDAEGCRLENGRVRMPAGFRDAYRALADGGWQGLSAPEAAGGQGLSGLELALVSEIFSGANHAMQMVTGLVPGAIRTLVAFGTGDQRARHLPRLASGEVLSTMALTEPGAGSDLSRIRAKAVRDGDAWRLDGEKIFISGGDQDLSDGILHFVLARTSDDGLRGLSLFLVDGPLRVTRIEEKMGLHASPTCQIALDGARAELVGEEGAGLAAMFTLMNHARIDVALQGVAHAARARDIAGRYAEGRVQGRHAGRDAKLTDHADVRRMLDEIDAAALIGRALTHWALVRLETGDDPALVEFLTPLAKIAATEGALQATSTAMQVLGGYGYLREYALEQHYRDARITPIYEGANGIHARALAGRALRTGAADAFARFLAGRLGDGDARAVWEAMRARIAAAGEDGAALAHDFATLSADCATLALAPDLASRADDHPEPERIRRVLSAASRRAAARIAGQAFLARNVA